MNIKELLTTEIYFFGSSQSKKRVFDAIVAMVKAGIDIVTALDRLASGERSKYEQRLLKNIRNDLHDGMPLWKSFTKYKLIPRQLITLVRIGEQSGKLASSLATIQTQVNKNSKFRSKLITASLYPLFVTALLIIVAAVMILFVLPQLSTIYRNLGSEPPTATLVLIAIGDFSQAYGYIVVPIALILIAIIGFLLFGYSKTRFIGDSLLFRTPAVHKIILEIQTARMGLLMNNLLSEGIPIIEAFNILTDATQFHEYRKIYDQIAKKLYEGHTFSAAFSQVKNLDWWIPAEAQLLIINGEQTGELAESFANIGEIYEEKTDNTAKNFGTLFEPFLIIVVWIGVALVAFSVILPLYSVVGQVGDFVDPQGNLNQPLGSSSNSSLSTSTAPVSYPTAVPDSRDQLLSNNDTSDEN